jgi:hypothetical protein
MSDVEKNPDSADVQLVNTMLYRLSYFGYLLLLLLFGGKNLVLKYQSLYSLNVEH